MSDRIERLKRLYHRFNERDIDSVLAAMSEDVVWANAMEGGHEQGRDAVRAYWGRQSENVRAQVEPVNFRTVDDQTIVVEVRQTMFDLDGNALTGQPHGLANQTVQHRFQFVDDQIVRFDVEAA